ncbi:MULTISPECIES: hypothetical protein [unclassified Moraxella]|uniref:hypothetical protein n=1 Tax=unclassified Moraxella TaxID=2685852 RepID=UPI003AF459ED
MIIRDTDLHAFLTSHERNAVRPLELQFIGNQGEGLLQWQVHFNQLSVTEMYNEYKIVINQLMVAEMAEAKRLQLMNQVNKVAVRLMGQLRLEYQNQLGFLNERQQQTLDSVLSIYYLGVMFYHSVWQRIAEQPQAEAKGFLGGLFGTKSDSNDGLIEQCIYGMVNCLRLALLEKHVGYRRDTHILWSYLHQCYRLVLLNQWQHFSVALVSFEKSNSVLTQSPLQLGQLYRHCILNELLNPYACRRPDLLALQALSEHWVDDIRVEADNYSEPYIFVDLQGNQPPQIMHTGLDINPFAKHSECLFISLDKLDQKLNNIIAKREQSDDMEVILNARHAKLMYDNLVNALNPPIQYKPVDEPYQVVVGFKQIHYMVANRTSLGNLIHAHELPERYRPSHQNIEKLNKSKAVSLVGQQDNHYHFTHDYHYESDELSQHISQSRTAQYTAIGQLQVKSLIALRHTNDPQKTWYLGYVQSVCQSLQRSPSDERSVKVSIDTWVDIFASNMVACGIRIQKHGNRQPNFMPALVIPQNVSLNRQKTTIIMARYGYNLEDKLILRIDNKEVIIRLTKLVSHTDDIEEYMFVRVQ